MSARRKPAQLLDDDLPIFTGSPIMVPDTTRQSAPDPKPAPPVSEWDWCGTLFDTEEASCSPMQ